MLGSVLQQLGRLPEAEPHLKRAIELDPKVGPPYWIWQTTSPNWIKVVSPTAQSSASYTLMYSTESIIASAAGVYKQSVHFVPGA